MEPHPVKDNSIQIQLLWAPTCRTTKQRTTRLDELASLTMPTNLGPTMVQIFHGALCMPTLIVSTVSVKLSIGIWIPRPLAIGQKHIVVTCNYAARAASVTKLMLRDEAHRRCPHLLLVEGSDLERYRIHGRRIYESFRQTCQRLRPNCSVAKGSMDEMVADLTCVTSSCTETSQTGNACDLDGPHPSAY